MDNYILSRVCAAARYTLELAQIEGALPHQGMKGRFRELLVDNVLTPWLPPYISCGTGIIIAAENRVRESTQDDIVIYDKSLVPPVLVSPHAPEGVFLFNSVLARIEVKSKLTRRDIVAFVRSSMQIADLRHSVQPGCVTSFTGAFNLLFAFSSDATGNGNVNFELSRLLEVMREEGCEPLSGKVSMLCVPTAGFWKLGMSEGQMYWQRLLRNTPEANIAWFVGCISNSCYSEHAKREGRDPTHGLEGGVGMYFPHPFENVQA